METFLRILGDGLTITALSIMCAISQMAWKRVPPDVRVPMQWNWQGRPTWRANRTIAFWLSPVLAALLLFGISAVGLTRKVHSFDSAVILFGVRSLLAAFFALMHLLHIQWAMKTLIEDGDI